MTPTMKAVLALIVVIIFNYFLQRKYRGKHESGKAATKQLSYGLIIGLTFAGILIFIFFWLFIYKLSTTELP